MFKKIFCLILPTVFLLMPNGVKSAPKPKTSADQIKAVYLGSPNIFNERKIAELEDIVAATNCNGIVIDFKDSNSPNLPHMAGLVKRFKNKSVYTIARIVVFQDTYFAKKHPEIAVKTISTDEFWWSAKKEYQRYWLDPASLLAQNYNIEIAKKAIDIGFDEIQFDYIRFPTDGNMQDIRFPAFKPGIADKASVMKNFLKKIRNELKIYSPKTLIGIDLFGVVFFCGKEEGIGQHLKNVAEYFDVLCPMLYPTHFPCKSFGILNPQDPSAHPYLVYHEAIKRGLRFLENKNVIVRPWIQDFSIKNIYNCGPTVIYTKEKVLAQIQAGKDLGINGFMLWNASSNFTKSIFSANDGE